MFFMLYYNSIFQQKVSFMDLIMFLSLKMDSIKQAMHVFCFNLIIFFIWQYVINVIILFRAFIIRSVKDLVFGTSTLSLYPLLGLDQANGIWVLQEP